MAGIWTFAITISPLPMQTEFGKFTRPYFFAHLQNELGLADGILHITLTRNNTLLTLTDITGDVLT